MVTQEMNTSVLAPLREEEWCMLADDIEEGEYAFFVASGLSREAGLPIGSELAMRIVQKLYRFDSNAIDKFRMNFSYTGPLSLPKVTQVIENVYGRERLTKTLIRCVDWNAAPAYVHQCLSLLALRIRGKEKAIRIITPNYDSLLEDSITLSKDVIILQEDHTNAHDPWPWILKIHGCIRSQPELTIRITASDLKQPLEQWKQDAIRECLSRRGLVVIGYGATDIHIRKLVNKGIREANKPSYWVSTGSPPSPIIKSLATQGGRYIQMDAATFFKNIGVLTQASSG